MPAHLVKGQPQGDCPYGARTIYTKLSAPEPSRGKESPFPWWEGPGKGESEQVSFRTQMGIIMQMSKHSNHRKYIQILRQMSPEERLLRASELSESAKRLFILIFPHNTNWSEHDPFPYTSDLRLHVLSQMCRF